MSSRQYIEMFPCTKVLCNQLSEQIDPMGNHWCRKHEGRRQVIRYGYFFNWAELVAAHYAIGPGYELYMQAVAWGKDEMIEEVQETVRQALVCEGEEAA